LAAKPVIHFQEKAIGKRPSCEIVRIRKLQDRKYPQTLKPSEKCSGQLFVQQKDWFEIAVNQYQELKAYGKK